MLGPGCWGNLVRPTSVLINFYRNASRVLQMNDDEISHVRRTWGIATKDPKATGQLLSSVLFELYPKYEETFSMFKTPGISSVRENPKFQKHLIENVLGTLGKLIDNLNNDDTVKGALHRLGASHKKRNLKPNDFFNITEIVVVTLTRGLGKQMDEKAINAWKKMLTNAMELASQGLK